MSRFPEDKDDVPVGDDHALREGLLLLLIREDVYLAGAPQPIIFFYEKILHDLSWRNTVIFLFFTFLCTRNIVLFF